LPCKGCGRTHRWRSLARAESGGPRSSQVCGGDSASKIELANVVIGRCASRGDRRNGRREPEGVEDGGGEVGVGEEREHAKPIATARALSDVLTEHAAQQRGPIKTASQHQRRPRRSRLRGGWGRGHDAGAPAMCGGQHAVEAGRVGRDEGGEPAAHAGPSVTHEVRPVGSGRRKWYSTRPSGRTVRRSAEIS